MPRVLAVLGVAATVLALSPAAAHGQTGEGSDPRRACPVAAPEAGAVDRERVPADHGRNVDCAALLDIAVGASNGLLQPRQPVRRDQMAGLVARSLEAAGVALPDPGGSRHFVDVGTGNPHHEELRRLAVAGIVLGGPLGTSEDEYGPGLPARRDQVASVVVRARAFAVDEDVDGQTAPFDDVSPGNVHSGHIGVAAARHLMLGVELRGFGPAGVARRDQTAAVTVRLAGALAAPTTLELTEPAGSAATGQSSTVTATVHTQFREAAGGDARWPGGEVVTFSAEHEGGPGGVAPVDQRAETDETGQAAFSFTASDPGTVTVTARISGPGGNFVHADGDRAAVQQAFVSAAGTGTLELTPDAATSQAPGEHTVRATLTEAGRPAAERAIRFEVYREGDETFALSEDPRASPRRGMASTGPNGEPAEFSYTFGPPLRLGEEGQAEQLIVACEAADDDHCVSIISGIFTERPHDTAVKTWLAPSR